MKFSAAFLTLLPASVLAASGEFSYDPDHPFGPASWAAVDVTGNQCGGTKQSGIDVPVSACDVYDNYVFEAGTCTLDDMSFKLMAHVIQADFDGDCQPPTMQIPGEPNLWEAVQFHIHTGSDHAVGGVYYGADMHLVHKEIGGDRFAVLGMFLEPTSPSVGKFSDLLTEWEAVSLATLEQCAIDFEPTPSNQTVTTQGGVRRLAGESTRRLDGTFNPYDLLPSGYSIYTYDGSLTTPPCSEIVYWNVVDTPVSISVREYLGLTNLIIDYVDPETCEYASVASPAGFTGRPVQAINGREITRHCRPGTVDEEAAATSSASMAAAAGALASAALALAL